VKPEYTVAEKFSEGPAVVGYGNYMVDPQMKRGYINHTGKEVIQIKCYVCRSFVNGSAAVSETPSSKYGLIDKTGKTVSAAKFDEISEFDKTTGLAGYPKTGKRVFKYERRRSDSCRVFCGIRF
jgi:hypothetical protein